MFLQFEFALMTLLCIIYYRCKIKPSPLLRFVSWKIIYPHKQNATVPYSNVIFLIHISIFRPCSRFFIRKRYISAVKFKHTFENNILTHNDIYFIFYSVDNETIGVYDELWELKIRICVILNAIYCDPHDIIIVTHAHT